HRWFESKPLWARIVIMIAGVCMNVLLAVVVATVVAIHYGRVTMPTTVVGRANAFAGAPELAQLQTGDSIRAVNGHPVANWNDVRRDIASSDRAVRITTQRGVVDVPLGRAGATAQDIADSVVYYLPPVIDSIFPGDPASRAGLARGDSIVSAAGTPVRTWSDMVDRTEPLTVTPKAAPDTDPVTGAVRTIGRIGAGPHDPSRKESISLLSGVTLGLKITWTNAGAVYKVLHDIGSGKQ